MGKGTRIDHVTYDGESNKSFTKGKTYRVYTESSGYYCVFSDKGLLTKIAKIEEQKDMEEYNKKQWEELTPLCLKYGFTQEEIDEAKGLADFETSEGDLKDFLSKAMDWSETKCCDKWAGFHNYLLSINDKSEEDQKPVESKPKRYSSRMINGMDVIDLIKHWNLNFNQGNVLKYLLRDKGEDISDMEKIADYANRESAYLKQLEDEKER